MHQFVLFVVSFFRRRWLPLLILAAYLATRLFHLGLLPMVSDEGTYITWGVRALHARGVDDLLASLEDGKQPLLAWLMPPFLAVLPDRLIAGRLVSVLAGLANTLLLARLGRRLYGARATWIAPALYVAVPIALIHDRMALYDTLVATTSLAVLWAALAWADRPDWWRTLWLGLAIGTALLTKLSALFFVLLVPVAIGLWRPAALRRAWRLAQAAFIAAAIYSVLYLSPIVQNIEEGNFQRYSLTAGEVLALPWAIWWKNATFIYETATSYLGWPVLLLAAVGLGWGVLAGGRAGRVVALWTLLPLLAFLLTAKIIYSRYVVFCFVTALLPAGGVVGQIVRRRRPLVGLSAGVQRGSATSFGLQTWVLGAVLGAVVLASVAQFDGALLADPVSAPWMNDTRYITDRFQYVESNYAGYGLRQVIDYVEGRARVGPVVVVTRINTGMPRDGVTAYLLGRPNVTVAFTPDNVPVVERLALEPDAAYLAAARGAPVFYATSDAPQGEQVQRFQQQNPAASLLVDAAKPGNHSRFQLYQVHFPAAQVTWLDPPPLFGKSIELVGYQVSAQTARPGDVLRLTLYWRALRRPGLDYTVFNHVEDASGHILGQHDGQPAGGRRPAGGWKVGDTVGDVHEVVISRDAAPGSFSLLTGFYDLRTQQRLPVSQEGQPRATQVVLGTITLTGP